MSSFYLTQKTIKPASCCYLILSLIFYYFYFFTNNMPMTSQFNSSVYTFCGQTSGQRTLAISSGSVSTQTHTQNIMNNAKDIDTDVNRHSDPHLKKKTINTMLFFFLHIPSKTLPAMDFTQTYTHSLTQMLSALLGLWPNAFPTWVVQKLTAGDGLQLLLLLVFVRIWVHLHGCTPEHQWCIQMSGRKTSAHYTNVCHAHVMGLEVARC